MSARYSVIIPTLNEEKFLPKLLASLATQTDKNFEVIVVDGMSRDSTVAMAKKFAKKLPKLTVLVSQKASLPLQRNLGAKKSKGEWLIFVDADGVLLPNFIERISAFIAEVQPKLFTTWFRPDTENPKDAVYTLFCNMYLEATLIFKKPIAPGPLSIIRRDVYTRVGGYDEDHAFHEDVDLGIRLLKRGVRLFILRESLCIWSLRRFRKQGTLKVLNQYVLSLLPVLLANRSFKHMPGYAMGGHLYGKKQSILKRYERKFRDLLKEVFA